MRVLLVTGSFPPMRCGVGDYSYRLAKALSTNPTIQIGVLTSSNANNKIEKDGTEVFPLINSWNLYEALKIINLIRNWSPNLVHIQYPTQGYQNGFLPWIIPIIAFAMRKKVVQTWHESYGRRSAPKLLLKTIIPGGLIVVRPQFKENLPRFLHWAVWNKKYVFIRNASPFPKINLDKKAKNNLRTQYLNGKERLIVFFGFVYPNKGAELLFEISNPSTDQIVIIGEFAEDSDYHQKIMALASTEPWAGKVTITGFLPPIEISSLLTIADAVVLPYRVGGGEWNTSIHAAVLQGAFVITTSMDNQGYDAKHNVFYTKIDDTQEMKSALNSYAGRKRKIDSDIDKDEWNKIAEEHLSLYESLFKIDYFGNI